MECKAGVESGESQVYGGECCRKALLFILLATSSNIAPAMQNGTKSATCSSTSRSRAYCACREICTCLLTQYCQFNLHSCAKTMQHHAFKVPHLPPNMDVGILPQTMKIILRRPFKSMAPVTQNHLQHFIKQVEMSRSAMTAKQNAAARCSNP